MNEGNTLYALMLNPIVGPVEDRRAVAYSDSKEKLEAFVVSETVPTYSESGPNPHVWATDWTFHKTFRKGGPLEHYNRPDDNSYVPFPTLELALKQEEVRYTAWLSRIHKVE